MARTLAKGFFESADMDIQWLDLPKLCKSGYSYNESFVNEIGGYNWKLDPETMTMKAQ